MEKHQLNQPSDEPIKHNNDNFISIFLEHLIVPLFALAGSILIVIGLVIPTGCDGLWGSCLGGIVQDPFWYLVYPELELEYMYRSGYIFLIGGALGIMLFSLSMRNYIAVRLTVGITYMMIGLYFIQSIVAMDRDFMLQFEEADILSHLTGGWSYVVAGGILLLPCFIFRQRPKAFYTEVNQEEPPENEFERQSLFAIRMAIFGTIIVGVGSLRLLTLTNFDYGIRAILLANPVGLAMLGLTLFGIVAIQIGRSSGIAIIGMAGLFECFVLKIIGGDFSFDNLFGIGLIALLVGSVCQVIGGIMLWLALYGEQIIEYEENKHKP